MYLLPDRTTLIPANTCLIAACVRRSLSQTRFSSNTWPSTERQVPLPSYVGRKANTSPGIVRQNGPVKFVYLIFSLILFLFFYLELSDYCLVFSAREQDPLLHVWLALFRKVYWSAPPAGPSGQLTPVVSWFTFTQGFIKFHATGFLSLSSFFSI